MYVLIILPPWSFALSVGIRYRILDADAKVINIFIFSLLQSREVCRYRFEKNMYMTITPQTYRLLENKMVFNKVFVPSQSSWEIVDSDSERTFVKNNHYYMENLTDSKWNYYKNKMPNNIGENWLIETQIELLSKDQYGHFGIVWGFDESREYLNRFTVSADGERGLVTHFQKDHHRIRHRFQKNFTSGQTYFPVHFALLKLDNYFYFLVNRQLMYICEQSHLGDYGNYFGYYIEPGLFIKSSYMNVNRLTVADNRKEHFDCLFF